VPCTEIISEEVINNSSPSVIALFKKEAVSCIAKESGNVSTYHGDMDYNLNVSFLECSAQSRSPSDPLCKTESEVKAWLAYYDPTLQVYSTKRLVDFQEPKGYIFD
jgi:hypothetical protein